MANINSSKPVNTKAGPKALPERRMWRVKEFTENYRISSSTTYKLLKSGELKSIFVAGIRLIPVESAEELMKRNSS